MLPGGGPQAEGGPAVSHNMGPLTHLADTEQGGVNSHTGGFKGEVHQKRLDHMTSSIYVYIHPAEVHVTCGLVVGSAHVGDDFGEDQSRLLVKRSD